MSHIKLKSSEINNLMSRLEKANSEFEEEFSKVITDLKSLASNESAMFSESASANLITYIGKLDIDVSRLIKEGNKSAYESLKKFISGIEEIDKG